MDPKVILGELCALAPSNEVRDCLRLYKPKATYATLYKSFDALSTGRITESLNYLRTPTSILFSDLKKEGIVRKLIFRLHNLMPEECQICSEEYAVHREATPLNPCQGCGQDIHMDCLATKLGISTEELVTKDIKSIVNPLDIPGLTYLCPTCKSKATETEDSYIKVSVIKKRAKSTTVSSNSQDSADSQSGSSSLSASLITEDVEDITPSVNEDVTPPANEHTNTNPAASVTDASSSANPAASVTNVSLSSTEDPPSQRDSQESSQPKGPTNQQILSSDPKSFPNMCPDYLKNKCRKSTCLMDHPRPCYDLLDYGTKGQYGCDGKTCTDLHPPICKDSLKNQRCFNQDCQLWHMKGTVRKKRSEAQENDKQSTDPVAKETSSTHQTPVSFLENVRHLKSEILEAMDTRFATILSQISPVLEARGSQGNATQGVSEPQQSLPQQISQPQQPQQAQQATYLVQQPQQPQQAQQAAYPVHQTQATSMLQAPCIQPLQQTQQPWIPFYQQQQGLQQQMFHQPFLQMPHQPQSIPGIQLYQPPHINNTQGLQMINYPIPQPPALYQPFRMY